jgi:hypothetical protein
MQHILCRKLADFSRCNRHNLPVTNYSEIDQWENFIKIFIQSWAPALFSRFRAREPEAKKAQEREEKQKRRAPKKKSANSRFFVFAAPHWKPSSRAQYKQLGTGRGAGLGYLCMYPCIYVCIYVQYVCMYVYMYLCLYVQYICMYVLLSVWMYLRMYVCMCMWVYIYRHMGERKPGAWKEIKIAKVRARKN